MAGIDWHYVGTVLEPSAGKGDLVKAVAQNAQRRNYDQPLDVDCVEIDPYLRSILDYEFGGKREDEIWERRKQLNGKEGWNTATRSRGEWRLSLHPDFPGYGGAFGADLFCGI
ncbi:hypothetical protein [Acutalibacter sp. 1XD8-36]|uniref:hypothetical protein n=1 Tax=Acutalibacter sp. 1XD8-36 TaxID=2320852 RepID=UPI0014126D70|nr:hypothetical protein [Acutalibacter sp. 1XD8-36]NBJ88521.1 hypothetical protein [Acutalibacter sp. 1XD8-36]